MISDTEMIAPKSKLKLEVKIINQELSNELLYISVAQIELEIWLKQKVSVFDFRIFCDFVTFSRKMQQLDWIDLVTLLRTDN